MRRFVVSLFLLCLATSAGADDRPSVRISFLLPTGQSTTFNGFDPAALSFHHFRDVRTGTTVVTDQYLSGAEAKFSKLNPLGARLRLNTWNPWNGKRTALSIDASWERSQRSEVIVASSDLVSTGRYYEHCPYHESYCTDYGGRWDRYDTQLDQHNIDLHVFRAGFTYDLAYRSRHFSIEPGVGLEWSIARHRHRNNTNTCDYGRPCKALVNLDGTTWPNSNDQTGYASLSTDIYPAGKHRPFAIGTTTRYLFSSGDWHIHNDNLAGGYDIPLRSRRWSTSVSATLAF